MPRIGSDLHNVVSTMLSADQFGFLKRLAKDYYNRDIISQPTISHVLRYLVTKEKELANNEHNLRKSNRLPQAADKERMSKGHAYHTDSSTSSLNATANPGDQANRGMTEDRRKINDLHNYKLPSVAEMESMSKSYPCHTDPTTLTLNAPFIAGLENYRQALEMSRQRNAIIRLAKTGSAKKDKSTKATDGSQVFGPSY